MQMKQLYTKALTIEGIMDKAVHFVIANQLKDKKRGVHILMCSLLAMIRKNYGGEESFSENKCVELAMRIFIRRMKSCMTF